MIKIIIPFLLFSFCHLAHSMTPFENHLLSVSRGMAAFYMYDLTEGDNRYKVRFTEANNIASQHLKNSKVDGIRRYIKDWDLLSEKLHFKVTKSDYVFIDWKNREDYRKYLTRLFIDIRPTGEVSLDNHIKVVENVTILSSFLVARSLDVVSSDYGATSLDDYDRRFNSLQVVNKLDSDINSLLQLNLPSNHLRSLRKVSSQLHFIKSTLVDHRIQTAYTLLYSSMLSIGRLLDSITK